LHERALLVADDPEVTREAMLLPEDGGSVVLARVGVLGGAGLDSEGGMAGSVGATLAGRSGAPACTGGAVHAAGAHAAAAEVRDDAASLFAMNCAMNSARHSLCAADASGSSSGGSLMRVCVHVAACEDSSRALRWVAGSQGDKSSNCTSRHIMTRPIPQWETDRTANCVSRK
jgi:hypothetical protein